jgi:hypothetical protein
MAQPKTLPFTPIVNVTRREDGRYDVEFDWADSYVGDTEGPDVEAACEALDAWVKRQPKTVIVQPATN